MSAVEKIEAAVQRLSPVELAELRAWLEGYCEERLELTTAEAGKLDAWADKERAAGRTKVFESPSAYAAQVRAKRSGKIKSPVKIETTRRYDRGFDALSPTVQDQVLEAIPALVDAFGKPHVHLGLCKLRGRLYEFRVGLQWRLVFRHDDDTLFFLLIGTHDEVRRLIRSL